MEIDSESNIVTVPVVVSSSSNNNNNTSGINGIQKKQQNTTISAPSKKAVSVRAKSATSPSTAPKISNQSSEDNTSKKRRQTGIPVQQNSGLVVPNPKVESEVQKNDSKEEIVEKLKDTVSKTSTELNDKTNSQVNMDDMVVDDNDLLDEDYVDKPSVTQSKKDGNNVVLTTEKLPPSSRIPAAITAVPLPTNPNLTSAQKIRIMGAIHKPKTDIITATKESTMDDTNAGRNGVPSSSNNNNNNNSQNSNSQNINNQNTNNKKNNTTSNGHATIATSTAATTTTTTTTTTTREQNKLFVCRDHDNRGNAVAPVSIAICESMEQAYKLLDMELKDENLSTFDKKRYTFQELKITEMKAYVLSILTLDDDGDNKSKMDNMSNLKARKKLVENIYANAKTDAKNKLFLCNNHFSCTPVLPVSIIIAPNHDFARDLLDDSLVDNNAPPHKQFPYTMSELPMIGSQPYAKILYTGDC